MTSPSSSSLLPDITHQGGALFFALLLFVVVTFVAKKSRFFSLPAQRPRYPLPFFQVVGIFALFFLISYVVLPLFLLIILYFHAGSWTAIHNYPSHWLGWIQIGAFFLLLIALLFYCKSIKKESFEEIVWGGRKKRATTALKDLAFGAMSWIVSYPAVMVTAQLTGFLSFLIWGRRGVEQAAVKQLLKFLEQPLLFGLLAFGIVFIIPFLEELLFRGFLQTWLKRYFSRGRAILFTSLLFAFVHFAPSQGLGNFELIPCLFVLSGYLGFLYERQQTLWAPVGLHMTFNGFTIVALLLSNV